MKLNNDQTRLVYQLFKFWNDPTRQYFVLSGQAGVGKTTCMRFFKDVLKKQNTDINICMSAPTNKATAVLNDAVNDPDLTYKTIYSILGLRMQANGEFKELTDSGEDKISDFDLVIIDEASMVNTNLIEYIKKKTALADTKIVFIGDKQQLPPVNEEESPIWAMFNVDYELTEVMRHQNSILDFVQSIRANSNPVFKSPGKEVCIANEDDFIAQIKYFANLGHFHEGKAKAIAWRNVTVDFLNRFIRDNNVTTKSDDRFVIGDRLVVKEPILGEGNKIIAATDEESEVIGIEVVRHMKYATLKAWRVSMRMDHSGAIVNTYVVHEESEAEFQRMLDEFKEKKRWDLFWKLKEAFGSVSYGYALTAHRSQGSSYPTIFVDAGDIELNRKIDERMKCLYVACSRASKELWIFP